MFLPDSRSQHSQSHADADPREVYDASPWQFTTHSPRRDDDFLLSPPVAVNQHPADILRDLEQEATVLQRLQMRMNEQLLRLQDEEAALRKQMGSS